MKRALVLGFVGLVLVAIGCAPDALPATTTCESITDCPLRQVCDRSTHRCIAEPDNRFLGRFHCKVTANDVTDLQLSEIVGRARNVRYVLNDVSCKLYPDTNTVNINILDDIAEERLFISLKGNSTGRVTIGPAIRSLDPNELPFVEIESITEFTRQATSSDGFIELGTALVEGADLDAYLDINVVLPPSGLKATFGQVCKNGLADCGSAQAKVGGANTCQTVAGSQPICTRSCTANGDCSLGKGVCNHGVCVRACAVDADCADLGLICAAPASSQESKGCVR